MKIVADENIPLVDHYFSAYGDIVFKSGREIKRNDLMDADILLVRSVTEVNEKLLHGTTVKFVGSTTIGLDHIDTEWLDRAGIAWAIAKGCNATAVVEYVLCVIAALQNKGFLQKDNLRAAVIGVGNIGSQVVLELKKLGFDVLQCDPFRAEDDKNFLSTTLENIQDVDFISIHTPLSVGGRHPTYHLIEKNFIERQTSGSIFLNTSRGSVVNFSDLKQYGKHLHWCLDVWEHEPNIDLDILKSTLIATPHIAGYSIQSKYRGIEMIYHAALDKEIIQDKKIPSVPYPRKAITFGHPTANWRESVLQIYDPTKTSAQMKEVLLSHSDTFDNLRKHFVERYEFNFVDLE